MALRRMEAMVPFFKHDYSVIKLEDIHCVQRGRGWLRGCRCDALIGDKVPKTLGSIGPKLTIPMLLKPFQKETTNITPLQKSTIQQVVQHIGGRSSVTARSRTRGRPRPFFVGGR